MSSLISGVGKLFTSLGGGGMGATLGSAVRGVGASLFTAGAATGSSLSGGSGGLSSLFGGGGGVLSNMINGAARIFGGGAGGLTGMAAGVTGIGSALGVAPAVGATSAVGLGAGPWGAGGTPTGFLPTGNAGGGGLLGGLTQLASAAAPAIGGIGEALGVERAAELTRQQQQDLIDQNEKRFQDIRSSYDVPASVYAGGGGYVADPTPRVTPRERWVYENGEVKKKVV